MKLTSPNAATRQILHILIAAACIGHAAANAAEPPNSSRKPHYYGQVKAYCIGIDKYDADGIPPLTSAESEAKTLHDTLQQKFGFSTELLIGKKATKANIDRIVEDSKTLGKNDALVVFFGGHGEIVSSSDGTTRTGFLIPFDAKLNIGARLRAVYSMDEFRNQAIEMRDFADKLKALPVGHVLLIADACHSGVLAKRGGTETQLLETVLISPSRTVITSAGHSEAARDGLFSVQLNKLLTDSASKQIATSTDTLFRSLFDETVKNQSTLRQIPQIAWFGDEDGRFVFFPLDIPADEMADLKQRLTAKRLTADPTHSVRGIQEALKQQAGIRLKPKAVVEAMTAGNYWYGNNIEEDRKHWLAKKAAYLEAAKFGDPLGLAGLFFCAKRGFGGTVNPRLSDSPREVMKKMNEQAFQIALQAADANDRKGYGKYLLGICYLQGIGTTKNEVVGNKLIDQAVAVNNPFSIVYKLDTTQARLKLPDDKEKLLEPMLNWSKQLYDLEIPYGFWSMSVFYKLGIGGYPKDLAKSEELLTRGARAGDPHSILALAVTLRERDIEKSRTLLVAAADSGFAKAQHILAIDYWKPGDSETLFGFPKDRNKAAQLYQDAADQDFLPALGAAAEAFTTDGPEADEKLARKYIERGKELKVADCYAMEANCFNRGRMGYEKSADKAIDAFRSAILLGYPDGTLIFELYRLKGGGELNEWSFHGYHWLTLAYLNCNQNVAPAFREKNLAILKKYHPSFLDGNAVSGPWKQNYPKTYAEYLKLFDMR